MMADILVNKHKHTVKIDIFFSFKLGGAVNIKNSKWIKNQ